MLSELCTMERPPPLEEEQDESASRSEERETWNVDDPMELHKLISERHARKTKDNTQS
jgi:hypothetical protein